MEDAGRGVEVPVGQAFRQTNDDFRSSTRGSNCISRVRRGPRSSSIVP